jgi:EmrB/QacA subfamily drug resistance transporter
MQQVGVPRILAKTNPPATKPQRFQCARHASPAPHPIASAPCGGDGAAPGTRRMNDSRKVDTVTPPHAEPRALDHAAAVSIIIGIMLAMFLSALEQSIVAPALPTIGRALGDADNLSWVVTAYLISTTVATPLFGKLSDIYGRRRMMLIAVGIFVIGSVACALAPTMWALILARALQGFGGGGLLPLGQTVIADLLSPRERPIVQAYSATMFMAASILGPVLGGVLTDYVHWSLIFWINVPMGIVALVITDRVLRRLPRNERPHKLDVVGAALMVAASIVLLLALAWGGTRYPWLSPMILGLAGASIVLWVLFGLRLARAPEPFIPLSMLRDKVVFGIVVAAFFSIGVVIGLSIFIPLYVELVLGHSASAGGLLLIAFVVGTTLGSMVSGRLMTRIERYKRIPVFAMPVGVVAMIVLAIRPGDLSLAEVAALLAIGGAGVGPMYPTTTVIMQNAVPLHQLGIATGTISFFRQLGGALVVAVFAALVFGGLGAHSLDRAGVDVAAAASSFRLVFIAAAICLAIAFVALVAIKEQPLRGPAAKSAADPVAAE